VTAIDTVREIAQVAILLLGMLEVDRPSTSIGIIESDRDSCYRRDSKGFFLILKRHSHAICLFDMRPCLEDIGHIDLVVLKSS